jgi:hypothetical protein
MPRGHRIYRYRQALFETILPLSRKNVILSKIFFARHFMKKSIFLLLLLSLFIVAASAQQLYVPRESQGASASQRVGDAMITVTYHRPSVKGRKIFGANKGTKKFLVPYGEVWRVGANDSTNFETSVDVMINGQKLPAGKYALFAIPTAGDWTWIFNKNAGQWGTEYDQNKGQDVLKVSAKPGHGNMTEALNYEFETVSPTTTKVVLRWEKLRVPFTVEVGDVNGRVLAKLKDAAANAKADDFRAPATAASFVYNNKMTASYADAMTWLDKSVAIKETFGNTRLKALIAAEMGNTKDAITWGEKALAIAKASTPPITGQPVDDLTKSVADWKAKK